MVVIDHSKDNCNEEAVLEFILFYLVRFNKKGKNKLVVFYLLIKQYLW